MNEQVKEIVPRDQRRAELAQLTFSGNGQLFQPKDGQQLLDMSNLMSTSGFMVKDIYRNNPGACMGLIAICAPYGLNPLQVSWKTYKAAKSDDAPIAFEAQVVVAMVNASGAVQGGLRYRYEGEGDNRVCICSGILAGSGEPAEVRSPPLGKISPKNSPLWKTDSDQQLAYYTGRNWGRRYKPEMLLGVYDVDELAAPIMKDISPKEPGGFAQKAMAARTAPQDAPVAPEAETLPPEPEPHWTARYEGGNGIPGSAAWERGVTDFEDGKPETDCPYDEGTEQAADWVDAWRGARRAKE